MASSQQGWEGRGRLEMWAGPDHRGFTGLGEEWGSTLSAMQDHWRFLA